MPLVPIGVGPSLFKSLSTMLFTRIWAALLSLALLCLFSACEPDPVIEEVEQIAIDPLPTQDELLAQLSTENEKNFFDLQFAEDNNSNATTLAIGPDGPQLDGLVAEMYIDFLRKHVEYQLVDNLIDRFGFPLWRRAVVLEGQTAQDRIITLPFAQLDDDRTGSVFLIFPDPQDPFYEDYSDQGGFAYIEIERSYIEAHLETIADDTTGQLLLGLLMIVRFDQYVFNYADAELIAKLDELTEGRPENINDQLSERGLCSQLMCLTTAQAVSAPQEVAIRDCSWTYIFWECGGGGSDSAPGSGAIGGELPAWDLPSSGGGGGGGDASRGALLELLANCASATSPDVEYEGEAVNAEACAALSAGIENLGFDALESLLWLQLYIQYDQYSSLLDLIATVSGDEQALVATYIGLRLDGTTTISFATFLQRLQAIGEVTQQLGFSDEEYAWLWNNATPAGKFEVTVAEEVLGLLEENAALLSGNYQILSEQYPQVSPGDRLLALVELTGADIELIWTPASSGDVSHLDAMHPNTTFVEEVYAEDQVPKIYMNLYGYGGATELMELDGSEKWVHHHWSYPMDMEVFYVYEPSLNAWLPFDPNQAQGAQMTILEALADAFLEVGHSSLDLVGLIPGFGEIADGVNAVWYIAEGDWENGLISLAAMVPVYGVGMTFGKYARNSLKLIKEGTTSFFVSPKGLKYATESAPDGIDRLGHVFGHVENVTHYPSGAPKPIHGVFDDPHDVVGIVDKAYQRSQDVPSSVLQSVTEETTLGPRDILVVELGQRVGWQGGENGTAEALTKLRFVFRSNTTEIITVFPY